MTRELKLALVVGFVLVLLVSVLIADHLSASRKAQIEPAVTQNPPVVTSPLADAQAQPAIVEPLVTITQGRGGGVQLAGEPAAQQSPDLTLTEPDASAQQTGEATTIAGQLASRVGEVVEQGLPPQMETARINVPLVVLSQQQTPGVDTLNANSAPQPANTPVPAPTTPAQTDTITGAITPPAAAPQAAQQPQQAAPAQRETAQRPAAQQNNDRWHSVASGESVYSIAKRYYGNGEHWRKLAQYNEGRVGRDGQVRVGVRLRIPDAQTLGISVPARQAQPAGRDASARPSRESRVAEAQPAGRTSQPASRAGSRSYTVKKGDTLSQISQRELGTVKRMNEIMRLNNLSNPGQIREGMKLTLPA